MPRRLRWCSGAITSLPRCGFSCDACVVMHLSGTEPLYAHPGRALRSMSLSCCISCCKSGRNLSCKASDA